jgi:hypothetical protein
MRNEIIPPLAVIVFTRSTVRSPSFQGGIEDAAQDESQGLPGEVHINNYVHNKRLHRIADKSGSR